MRLLRILLFAYVALASAGASLAKETAADAALEVRGKDLFQGNCAYCHGERGYATALLGKRLGPANALLTARSELPPLLIRTVVRHGINGMPWYRRVELTDSDLDAIVAFLTHPSSTQ